jgi:hypothetical protein
MAKDITTTTTTSTTTTTTIIITRACQAAPISASPTLLLHRLRDPAIEHEVFALNIKTNVTVPQI